MDMIILIQDSQGISSATFENIKRVVKRMLTKLSSESTDTNVAVATYSTSRRISCFGKTQQAISYLDKYRRGGSGLNLLNLALTKMVMKQFDKRPDDRKTSDTAQVSFIFSYFRLGPNFPNLSYKHYLGYLWYQEDRTFGKRVIKSRPQLLCSKNRNTLQDSRSQSLMSVVHNVNAIYNLIQQIVCNV